MAVGLTTQQVQHKLDTLNFGVIILSEYRDNKTKLNYKCKTCGDEDVLTFSELKAYGKRCSCNNYKKKIKWNIDLVKQFLVENNRQIELLSAEYKTYQAKLKFKCNVCNEEWDAVWGSVKSGNGCPNCSNSKPLSKNEMLYRLKENIIKKRYSILNESEIENPTSRFICECSEGHIWDTSYASLIQGCGCSICNKQRMSKQSKDKIIYAKQTKLMLKEINDNIEILNVDDDYMDLDCRCKVCGHEFKSRHHRLIISKNGCAVCAGNQTKIGYNDIQTTNPEFVKYFKKQEESKKPLCSKDSADFKCPDCGFEQSKIIYSAFATGKYSCGACSDGISIPNKMLANILSQLKLNFEVEKKFGKSNYRYDAYIKKDNIEYVFEAHGRQHYDKGFNFKDATPKDVQKNDIKKKEFAELNGLTYVEIDCKFSTYEHLSNSFTIAFKNIFDLNNVDLKSAYENSMSSKMIEACKILNNNPTLTPREIGEMLNVSNVTIRTYLKRGAKLGLCNYDSDKIKDDKMIDVLMIDVETGKIIAEYNSINSAARLSGDSGANIYRIINKAQGTTKKHTWIKKTDYKEE